MLGLVSLGTMSFGVSTAAELGVVPKSPAGSAPVNPLAGTSTASSNAQGAARSATLTGSNGTTTASSIAIGRRNLCLYSDLSAGSKPGIIGSGGVISNNSAIGYQQTGVVVTVTGSGHENSMGYTEVNFSGTPTAGGNTGITFDAGAVVAVSINTAYAWSIFTKVISGTRASEVLSASAGIGTGVGFASTATLTQQGMSGTTTAVGNAFFYYNVSFAVGVACNFTIRFYGPMIELGHTVGTFIPSGSSIGTETTYASVAGLSGTLSASSTSTGPTVHEMVLGVTGTTNASSFVSAQSASETIIGKNGTVSASAVSVAIVGHPAFTSYAAVTSASSNAHGSPEGITHVNGVLATTFYMNRRRRGSSGSFLLYPTPVASLSMQPRTGSTFVR